jgi:putative transposase
VVILLGSIPLDPTYMLLSAPPRLSPAKLVQYITGRSSRRLQAE